MKTFTDLILELSLGKAGAFANKAHSGQYRKSSGAPYIIHPTAVMKILKSHGVKDKNILVAAMLHDTIEDSPTTYNNLKSQFNKEVADFTKEVTSIKKDLKAIGKPEYLARKMIGMSNGALLIKLADRLHNSTDLAAMPEKSAKRQAEQTNYILIGLRSKRKNLQGTAKKLIKKIEKLISPFLESGE